MKVKFEDLDEVTKILLSCTYGGEEMILRFIERIRKLEAVRDNLVESAKDAHYCKYQNKCAYCINLKEAIEEAEKTMNSKSSDTDDIIAP